MNENEYKNLVKDWIRYAGILQKYGAKTSVSGVANITEVIADIYLSCAEELENLIDKND